MRQMMGAKMRLGLMVGVAMCGLAMQGVAQQTPGSTTPGSQTNVDQQPSGKKPTVNIPETMGPPDSESGAQSQRQRIPLPGDPPLPPPSQRPTIPPPPPPKKQQPAQQIQNYPPVQTQQPTQQQSTPQTQPTQTYQVVPQAQQQPAQNNQAAPMQQTGQPLNIPETMGPDVVRKQGGTVPGDVSAPVQVRQEAQPGVVQLERQGADTRPVTTVPADEKVKKLPSMRPFSRVAVGVRLNTLGPGAEIATPLGHYLNLRAGANFFRYGQVFDIDGVSYNADLNFNSGQVQVDYFPMRGGFHISPGVLITRNGLSAVGNVPPGGSFELGSQSYINSLNDPVHGTATVAYARNISPLLTIGWGNLLPRSGRHWSIPIEVGAAYTGPAQFIFNLQGTACQSNAPLNCANFATDPTVKQNVAQEQVNINELAKRVEVYPVASIGFAWSFR